MWSQSGLPEKVCVGKWEEPVGGGVGGDCGVSGRSLWGKWEGPLTPLMRGKSPDWIHTHKQQPENAIQGHHVTSSLSG